MTDMPGSRLWPLALMGWLAAIPPLPDSAQAVPAQEERERQERQGSGRPEERTAWLHAARARYAALSPQERERLREQRRAARGQVPRA